MVFETRIVPVTPSQKVIGHPVHDEQQRVITQRKNIFRIMKKQPDSRLVTLFQNREINSESHRI